jgi:hypothetical protein
MNQVNVATHPRRGVLVQPSETQPCVCMVFSRLCKGVHRIDFKNWNQGGERPALLWTCLKQPEVEFCILHSPSWSTPLSGCDPGYFLETKGSSIAGIDLWWEQYRAPGRAGISRSLLGGYNEGIRWYLVVFKEVSVNLDSLLEVYLFTYHFKFVCRKHHQGPAILLGRKGHMTQLTTIVNRYLRPSVRQQCWNRLFQENSM